MHLNWWDLSEAPKFRSTVCDFLKCDLPIIFVMFETWVLLANWRGSAVGLHSRLFGGGVVPNIVTFYLWLMELGDFSSVLERVRFTVCEIDFRDQGANLKRCFCDWVEHFKTVAQAGWLSGFRQYWTYASELMGLVGGTEISHCRVRFSQVWFADHFCDVRDMSFVCELERFGSCNAFQMIWWGGRT